MNLRQHIVICLIMLMLFSSAFIPPVSVSADSGDIHAPSSLGKAYIGETSYMELKDVMLLPGNHNGTVTFTLSVYNGESSYFDFIHYWVRLQSKAGNPFTVNLLPQDKDKNRIPAGTSRDFRFYAKVDASTVLQDLVFNLIQLDFSVPGFEKVVGQITAQDDFSFVTPAGTVRTLRIDDVPNHGKIKRASVSQNDEYYLPSLYLEMENIGNNGVKLPDLAYFIRTKSGQTYPLQSNVFMKDTTLQPQVNKEGWLSGSIPKEAGADGWQLVIAQPLSGSDNGESLQLPFAFFEVPEAVAENVSIGNDSDFSNNEGTYTARLTSLQRLPWEDHDILAANITLRNKGSQVLSIPDLQGYFKLDDAVTVEARLIQTDRVISLQPGKEINIQLAGKIPYTSEFQSVNLILQEKESDNKVIDLLTFHHNKELMNMKVIPALETRTLTDIGQSAAYTVRAVHTFQGDSADLFAVQMEVENLEKRFTDLRKQVAQFKAVDRTVFPAKVTEITSKVTPGGKALLYIWSTLPKGYDTEGMQLILGDEVRIPPTGPNEIAKQDGYVNAVSFVLPAEKKEPKSDFVDLEVYPYTVTFSHFGTQADFRAGIVKLDFDYELKKNPLVEKDMKDHKIIVELRDELVNKGKEIIISKTYDLEGTASDKALQPGNHDALISYTDQDKIYAIDSMKTYQMNIYHQFQDGQKKLLATKELEWFIYDE